MKQMLRMITLYLFIFSVALAMDNKKPVKPKEFTQRICLSDLEGEWKSSSGDKITVFDKTVAFNLESYEKDQLQDELGCYMDVDFRGIRETANYFIFDDEYILDKNSKTLTWKKRIAQNDNDRTWFTNNYSRQNHNILNNSPTFRSGITFENLKGFWTDNLGQKFEVCSYGGYHVLEYNEELQLPIEETDDYFIFVDVLGETYTLKKDSICLTWKILTIGDTKIHWQNYEEYKTLEFFSKLKNDVMMIFELYDFHIETALLNAVLNDFSAKDIENELIPKKKNMEKYYNKLLQIAVKYKNVKLIKLLLHVDHIPKEIVRKRLKGINLDALSDLAKGTEDADFIDNVQKVVADAIDFYVNDPSDFKMMDVNMKTENETIFDINNYYLYDNENDWVGSDTGMLSNKFLNTYRYDNVDNKVGIDEVILGSDDCEVDDMSDVEFVTHHRLEFKYE